MHTYTKIYEELLYWKLETIEKDYINKEIWIIDQYFNIVQISTIPQIDPEI